MSNQSDNRHLALKVVMMPSDTNRYGTIFGGVLLSYIDQAGAVGAYHAIREAGYAQKALVTVGMKSVEFHHPVHVGDVVSFWTRLVRIGRTSITVHVEVEAQREGQDDRPKRLTEAEVTFVAVDQNDRNRRTLPIRE